MGAFRALFILVVVAAVGGVAFMFAPENIKEKGLSFINQSPYIPSEIKKAAEDFYATPAMKRKKLVQELEQNLAGIETALQTGATVSTSTTVQLVQRSREIVEQVLKQNEDPTVIKQITDAVTAKLLESNVCKPLQN